MIVIRVIYFTVFHNKKIRKHTIDKRIRFAYLYDENFNKVITEEFLKLKCLFTVPEIPYKYIQSNNQILTQ